MPACAPKVDATAYNLPACIVENAKDLQVRARKRALGAAARALVEAARVQPLPGGSWSPGAPGFVSTQHQ